MIDARLTTNLAADLLKFLDQEAQKTNQTRRSILEAAIKKYQKERLKQDMIQGYNQMAENKAEIDDWLNIANNPQNSQIDNEV